MLKSVFLALFLLIIAVFGQDAPSPGPSESTDSSQPTRKQDRNGCFSFRACGKDGVLQSQPIDSVNDKGKPIRNHACQCKDGRLMLVNWRGTAVATSGGKATIIVPQPDGTKIEIDPKDWALSLKQFPACTDIKSESLTAAGVEPAECASNLNLGATCTEGCRATLKALGVECYSAAKYVLANPDAINLTPEELFNNCVNGEPYGGVKSTSQGTTSTGTGAAAADNTTVPDGLNQEIQNEKEEDLKVPAADGVTTKSSATKVTTVLAVVAAAAIVLV